MFNSWMTRTEATGKRKGGDPRKNFSTLANAFTFSTTIMTLRKIIQAVTEKAPLQSPQHTTYFM